MTYSLLAHHGNFFNHVLEGSWDELFTTPFDWFVVGMMLVFITIGVLLVNRWSKSRTR